MRKEVYKVELILKVLKLIYSIVHKELMFGKRCLIRWLELLGQLLPEDSRGCRIRGYIYQPFLKKCGRNFQVGVGVKLENLHNIKVGNDVYIGHGSWINGVRGEIIFEDQVMLGPFVTMVCGNHALKDGSYRWHSHQGMPIIIGEGTWIAAKGTIVSGITIGKANLVAAGAVVTKNTPPFSVVAGVPAKVIKNTAGENALNN